MTYHKAKKSTHQACRSLLQKAVRRGYSDLAVQVALHLVDIGDKTWLRSRSIVICAEECWPYIETFEYATDPLVIYQHISEMAKVAKNKDAAGLGALAYAFSEGDQTVIKAWESDRPIRIIASAIERPKDFWQWLAGQCATDEQQSMIKKLTSLHKKGGWPWDKAFIQAAAYLYIHEQHPKIKKVSSPEEKPFPYWVALDRHTPEGKNAIRVVAKQIDVPTRQLGWISFYLESAVTNTAQPAPWFTREKKWRLDKAGVNIKEAEEIWEKARPIFKELLNNESEQLQAHIDQINITTQESLF